MQGLRGQGAARAGLVLNNHGLAQDFAGAVGQRAHGDVGGAACGEGDDELDGFARKALGLRHERGGGQAGGSPFNDVTTLHGGLLKTTKTKICSLDCTWVRCSMQETP
ncbi:hypothetical protein D3C71_1758140 [compost metagenome]